MKDPDELDTTQALALIDQLYRCRIIEFSCILGREPLVRKDIYNFNWKDRQERIGS